MATDSKEQELFVEEGQDGTATVELPDDLMPHDAEPTQQSAQDDGDADHPDDTDAMRAARRARRRAKKDFIRKTNEEKDTRLQMLQRENEELKNRISNVERKTQSYDLSRLDKQLEDEHVRYEYAKMKLSEATIANDGEGVVNAQEMLYEARKRVEELSNIRKRADQEARAPATPRIDPEVQNHAANWIERNSWYKPDLSSTDSKIAKAIDEELTQEGWNPKTEEYWEELDNRLQNKLPHRYNRSSEGRETNRSPRNIVGSSGREASAAYGGTNRTFTLSAEQVRAMKDAGMWDNPEKRARMIKRYAAEARNYKGNQ